MLALLSRVEFTAAFLRMSRSSRRILISRRALTSSSRSALVKPSRRPASTSARLTHTWTDPLLMPRSRATSLMLLPELRTSCTTSALYSGVNRLLVPATGHLLWTDRPLQRCLAYRVNSTPRPQDTDGLSTFRALEDALKASGGKKAQIINLDKLDKLTYVEDSAGHVSIRPQDPDVLKEWSASRGGEEVHPLTEQVLRAIEDVARDGG